MKVGISRMSKLSETTFNLVNNFLKIRKKDIVTITGKINNFQQECGQLEEIPSIEELNIAIRKKEAATDIRLTSDNLQYRAARELLPQQNEFPENYHQSWVKEITTLIDISWHSLAKDMADELKDLKNAVHKAQAIQTNNFVRRLINKLLNK